MTRLITHGLLAAVLTVGVTGVASATSINTSGGDAPGLQTILDNITTGSTDVNSDQASPDSVYRLDEKDAAGIIIEVAGNAGDNTFGIYDSGTPATKIPLFSGSDSNTSSPVTLSSNGNVFTVGGSTYTFTDNGHFGFYLDSPDGTFYSQASLNNGNDHQVAFQGNGTDQLNLNWYDNSSGCYQTSFSSSSGCYQTWDSNTYLFGWEDKPASDWDQDYNDFVVAVGPSSNFAVPEPPTIAILGFGLLLLGFAVNRRSRRYYRFGT